MKTTDERMEQVLQQASATRARRQRQHQRIATWGGATTCLIVLVVASIATSSVGNTDALPGLTVGGNGLAASVFADSPAFGYLVVGLLGAMLGVALTVLVYRLGGGGDTKMHGCDMVDNAESRMMGEDRSQAASGVDEGNETKSHISDGALADSRGQFTHQEHAW